MQLLCARLRDFLRSLKPVLADTGIIIFKSLFYADRAPSENQLNILDGLSLQKIWTLQILL